MIFHNHDAFYAIYLQKLRLLWLSINQL